MDTEKKTDRRITRTKDAICQAFFSLTAKKPFAKITASEIISKAHVNRSTFYRYYRDKYDLLDQIEEAFFQGGSLIVAQAPAGQLISGQPVRADFEAYFAKMLRYCQENQELLLLFFRADAGFPAKVTKWVRGIYDQMFPKAAFTIPKDYAVALSSGIVSGLLNQWIASGCRETPEALSHMLYPVLLSVQSQIIQ